MTDFKSDPLKTLEQAQQKAEEAAAVIQDRFSGSYVKWINTQTLYVFSKLHARIATIHLETLQ